MFIFSSDLNLINQTLTIYKNEPLHQCFGQLPDFEISTERLLIIKASWTFLF